MIGAVTASRAVSEFGPLVAIVAAAACIGLILLLRPLLARHALAHPNARSSHRSPTPQGGGAAVVVAAIFSALAVPGTFGALTLVAPTWPVLAATAAIAVVGAIDDFRPMPVAPRLALQGLAVAAVIAVLPADTRVALFLPWWLERAALLAAGLWFVNLVNFMDGLDWMTVAEVVPITAGLAVLGALGALPAHGVILALALGGAVVGFAPFNRPTASIFLGDVGSLPIGLLLFWLLALVAFEGHAAAAVLLPLYYLADATLTLLRRLAKGEKVWEAHRSHFYQRATDRGLTVLQIVSRVFAVNLVLAVLAVVTVLAPSPSAVLAATLAGVCAVAWLLYELVRARA